MTLQIFKAGGYIGGQIQNKQENLANNAVEPLLPIGITIPDCSCEKEKSLTAYQLLWNAGLLPPIEFKIGKHKNYNYDSTELLLPPGVS